MGNEWISVKDRLPEDGHWPERYLAVSKSKGLCLACYSEYHNAWWVSPYRLTDITYWMPLPAPPSIAFANGSKIAMDADDALAGLTPPPQFDEAAFPDPEKEQD